MKKQVLIFCVLIVTSQVYAADSDDPYVGNEEYNPKAYSSYIAYGQWDHDSSSGSSSDDEKINALFSSYEDEKNSSVSSPNNHIINASDKKEQSCILNKITYKEQQVWFLNAFWSSMLDDQSLENVSMSEQEKKEADQFLQQMDVVWTIWKMRATLRNRSKENLVIATNCNNKDKISSENSSEYREIISKSYPQGEHVGVQFHKTLASEHNRWSFDFHEEESQKTMSSRGQEYEQVQHHTFYNDVPRTDLLQRSNESVSKKRRAYERLVSLNRTANRWKSMAQEYKPCSMKNGISVCKKNRLHYLNQPKKMKKG